MIFDADAEKVLRFRAKAALRQRARALRNTVPKEAIAERSARIVEALAALEAVAGARSVALFAAIPSKNEVDLQALDARLRARGVRLAYPAIEPESRVMTFRFVEDLAELVERGFGFREPGPGCEEALALDVVVVPALQIDERGHRLGYGAGYYDRTLPRFSPPARAVGVGFDFQLVADLPDTEGDVALEIVVTDTRTFEVKGG